MARKNGKTQTAPLWTKRSRSYVATVGKYTMIITPLGEPGGIVWEEDIFVPNEGIYVYNVAPNLDKATADMNVLNTSRKITNALKVYKGARKVAV